MLGLAVILRALAVGLLSSAAALAGEPWDLRVGATLAVELPDMARASIGHMGDQPLADLRVVGKTRLVLKGLAEGDATLSVVTKSGATETYPLRIRQTSEQGEVTAVLTRQAGAWNHGDLDGFCRAYAADAVFVSPSGVTKGRDEVLARYKKKYPDEQAMGKLALEPIDVRVNGDSATVAAKWTLSYPDRPAATGHTVVVLIRDNGRWRIVHDASM